MSGANQYASINKSMQMGFKHLRFLIDAYLMTRVGVGRLRSTISATYKILQFRWEHNAIVRRMRCGHN